MEDFGEFEDEAGEEEDMFFTEEPCLEGEIKPTMFAGTVSAPQLFASNTLIVTNTSDFSDDLFLTKNWAGWSKLQISNNSAASDSGPELRLLGNQSFLERDGGTHQCELIMINDEALVQTTSLSTQLSLTTNQRNPGCLVIAGNGQRGLQHELHGLVGQPGEDGDRRRG